MVEVARMTDPIDIAIIHPVGGQDILPGILPGPFPAAERFAFARDQQTKVRARDYGRALLDTLDALHADSATRARLVYDHLDAPILRRVLEDPWPAEAPTPRAVVNLTLVATDQVTPHTDDTVHYTTLLTHWLQGWSLAHRGNTRTPGSVEVITLTERPDLLVSVTNTLTPQVVRRVVRDCGNVLFVQAGGTPATTFGGLLSFMLYSPVEVVHMAVPRGNPLAAFPVPDVITRTRLAARASELLAIRRPHHAADLLAGMRGVTPAATQLIALADQLRLRAIATADERSRAAERIMVALDVLSPPTARQLRRLANDTLPGQLAAITAWNAKAAWHDEDATEFLQLVDLLHDLLPERWFQVRLDIDTSTPRGRQALRHLFAYDFSQPAFLRCRNLGSHDARRQLANESRPNQLEYPALEIVRSLATEPRQPTCGLGAAGRRGRLADATMSHRFDRVVQAWSRYSAGGRTSLKHLRNVAIHDPAPVRQGDLRAALNAGWGNTDGEQVIDLIHEGFDLPPPGSDPIQDLCDRAAELLPGGALDDQL